MHRLLFEKKGRSVWISHLDLMRLFQRAFKRAGLSLTHTQGFNPRPSVSIALPLSVGVQSNCELLDFTLEGEAVACEDICRRLNAALIDGVRVLQVYEGGRKLRELSLLQCQLRLSYDAEVSQDVCYKIESLFRQEELTVPKKSKNGIQDQNILPMIRTLRVEQLDMRNIQIEAVVCCQNPSLNPMQLAIAIEKYLPELNPDHVTCCRQEIYDEQGNIFR